jgi:ankyrin repeat protein
MMRRAQSHILAGFAVALVWLPEGATNHFGSANVPDILAVKGNTGSPLLETAAQPFVLSPVGERNVLLEAARRGDADAVRRILAEGADPNATDALGRTALHYAARKGYLTIVSALIDDGAILDVKDQEGFVPLHRAVQAGHTDVASILLARGADPSIRTAQGDLPLDIAVKRGEQAMIDSLKKQLGQK